VFNKMFCSVVKKALIFCALFCLFNFARAEGGCADGYYPANPPAPNVCYPFPETERNTQTQQYQIPLETRWGAIATDNLNVGAKSKRIAAKAAVAQCRSNGGTKCIVDIAYYNQCAVIVLGEKNTIRPVLQLWKKPKPLE